MKKIQTDTSKSIIASEVHPAHFKMADCNYDCLSLVSDGCLYYALSTHNIDTHAQVYKFNPFNGVSLLGSIGEIVREFGKIIPHGKSHAPFYEYNGKLYFSTHFAFYKAGSKKEEPELPPPGYKPYPGGHIISYDLNSGHFQKIATIPNGDGILTIKMDSIRKRIYLLTWPRGFFIYYDFDTNELRNLGQVSREGEIGKGSTYFCLCRSLGLFPDDGSIFFTNADGEINRYTYSNDVIEPIGLSLKREIFGIWDPHEPGHQGYNWRKIIWSEKHRLFYGVHPKSGYLFSFDPKRNEVNIFERIVAYEIKSNGYYEPFRYGYLGFDLGPDQETIYYLTGSHDHSLNESPNDVIHLVTFDLKSSRYQDHGVLRLDDGRYPFMTHTILVHPNGKIYTIPWIRKKKNDSNYKMKYQIDLVSFDNPIIIS